MSSCADLSAVTFHKTRSETTKHHCYPHFLVKILTVSETFSMDFICCMILAMLFLSMHANGGEVGLLTFCAVSETVCLLKP